MATVYRMVKTLEESGLIHRKNMYRIECEGCPQFLKNAETQLLY